MENERLFGEKFILFILRFYVIFKLFDIKTSILFVNIAPTTDVDAWNFLARTYYAMQPDPSTQTRQLLERAMTHLQRALQSVNSNQYFMPEYPQVKLLLGDPKEEIDAIFARSTDELEEGVRRDFLNHRRYYQRAKNAIRA